MSHDLHLVRPSSAPVDGMHGRDRGADVPDPSGASGGRADALPVRGILVPADGPCRIVTVADPEDWRELAGLIGAEYIEYVRTTIASVAMLVDEEGIGRDRPLNELMTGLLYPGYIYGDALLLGEVDGYEGREPAGLDDGALFVLRVVLDIAEGLES